MKSSFSNFDKEIAPFHRLFEYQVLRNPNKVAVECNGRQLTYKNLNQQANQLAHYLQVQHIGVGHRVGLYVERSLEMVVGTLGILKSGAAYVPLDPKYPKDRSAFILEETQISLLLSQEHLMSDLSKINIPVVCLQQLQEKFDGTETDNLERVEDVNSLAYIMYTSGSTGKPKGVQMTHRNIWHYLTGLRDVIPVAESDIYFHTASIAFSSSIRHLMVPLSQGAKVIIATRENTQNPLNLFQAIHQENITVLDTVASVWRHGIAALESSAEHRQLLRQSKLNKLVFSGGLLPCQLLQNVRAQFDCVPQIFNIYGQTESLGVCAYSVPLNFDQESGYVPVGTCYDHNQVFLVDENLQPVLPGKPGELCIAGPNVTQGYWKRPDINAVKFFPHLSDRQSPYMLFRSGDVGRFRPDGNLEILGRTDFQVKIRGMRVELDEIGSILEQHPAVKEAAIAAHEDHVGEKLLVAYFVSNHPKILPDKAQLHQQLRVFLQAKLPDYMVPSIYMDLEALPLTPNGKLNRLALPKPKFLLEETLEPSTSNSSAIRNVFCRTMNLRRIEADDTFITLGGHSLLYVQLSMELEKHLGYTPAHWENKSIEELESLAKAPHEISTIDNGISTIDTDIFLRAIAILAVVANHAHLVPARYIRGGSFLLLLIAGFNFARFQGPLLFQGDWKRTIGSLLKNLLVPYFIVAIGYMLYKQEISTSILLLYTNYLPHYLEIPKIFAVWFIQVMVQVIIALTLVFQIKPIRRFATQSPWLFGLCLLIFSSSTAFFGPLIWDTTPHRHRLPHTLMWIFSLGWMINFARSKTQKLYTSAFIIVATFLTYQTTQPTVKLWILVGGLILLWHKYIGVSKYLKTAMLLVAAAAYYLFLTHMAFFEIFEKIIPDIHPVLHDKPRLLSLVYVALSTIGGIAFYQIFSNLDSYWGYIRKKVTGFYQLLSRQ